MKRIILLNLRTLASMWADISEFTVLGFDKSIFESSIINRSNLNIGRFMTLVMRVLLRATVSMYTDGTINYGSQLEDTSEILMQLEIESGAGP